MNNPFTFKVFATLIFLSVVTLGLNSVQAQCCSIDTVYDLPGKNASPFCEGETISIKLSNSWGASANVYFNGLSSTAPQKLTNQAIVGDSIVVTIPVTQLTPGPLQLAVERIGGGGQIDSVGYTLNALEKADFIYTASSVCVGTGNFDPTMTGTKGTWTTIPAGILAGIMTTSGGNGGRINTNNAGLVPANGNVGVPIQIINTRTSAGGCVDTDTFTVTIVMQDTAWFNLPISVMCRNGENQVPQPSSGGCTPCSTITPGGIWTSSPSGVVFADPTSGEIDVRNTPAGTYDITYTTAGFCPHADTDAVEIRDTFNATFFYSPSTICKSGGASDPFPTLTVPGTAPGDQWSCPPQLDFTGGGSSSDGRIDVSNCTLGGPYTVTRIVPASGSTCADTATTTVTIVSLDTTQISYSSSIFCPNSPAQLVSFAPGAPGGTQVFTASSPNVNLNGATPGRIDTFATTPPGFYSIYFATTGSSCPAADTFDFQVLPLDVASFSYSSSSYCIALGNSPAAMKNASADTGYFWGTAGLVLDSASGVIDLIASDTGSYWVKYTTTGNCPNIDSFPVEIFRESAIFHYDTLSPLDTIRVCELDFSFLQPTVDGTGGGVFSDDSGILTPALNPSNGALNLSLVSTPGVYNIKYVSGGTCKDSSFVAIEIIGKDSVNFAYSTTAYCFGDVVAPVISRADSSSGGRFMSFIPGDTALVIDSLTGTVDVQATPAGFYAIKYVSDSTCKDSTFRIIQIRPRETISINYLQERYCKLDNNPVPAASGTGAGSSIFYCADTSLAINPTNGEIDLGASDIGMYVVFYTTGGLCPETAFDTVYVDDQAAAGWSFDLGINSFCQSDPNPIPTLDSASNPNGFWISSDPLNAIVDSANGEINLLASTPGGPYSLIYKIDLGAGTCPNQEAKLFTIQIPDTLTQIDYDTSQGRGYFILNDTTTVCKSLSSVFRAILSDSADRSGFFSCQDTNLVFADPFFADDRKSFTGEVKLSDSKPGIYEIFYTVTGVCITAAKHYVEILPADSMALSIASSFYCKNLTDPRLITTGTNASSSGQFDWVPLADPNNNLVLTANGLGVFIDLSASDEGTYSVYHFTQKPLSTCPDTAAIIVSLGDVPNPTLVTDPVSGIICDNDTIILEATNINSFDHDFYWYLGPDSVTIINPGGLTTGIFQHIADDPANQSNFILRTVDRDNGCSDTTSKVITVNPIPDGVIDRADTVISSDRPVEVDMLSNAPSTIFHYSMVPQGNLTPDTTVSDSTAPINTGQIATLSEDFIVNGNFVPAAVTVYITPIAFGCVGETDSVTIKLNPSDQDVFIPGIITPNGDGANDYWRIQVKSGIPLDQYAITLLNRSGGVAYEMFPLNENWTPDSLPDGVYWWVLKRADTNEIERRGGLTIRRK